MVPLLGPAKEINKEQTIRENMKTLPQFFLVLPQKRKKITEDVGEDKKEKKEERRESPP